MPCPVVGSTPETESDAPAERFKIVVFVSTAAVPTTVLLGFESAVPSQPKAIDPIGALRLPSMLIESPNKRILPPAESGRAGVVLDTIEIDPVVGPLS